MTAVAGSAAQRRFQLIERARPGVPELLTRLVVGLRGPLDRTSLHQTLDILVRRHDMLRVRFDGGGVPRIDNAARVEIEFADGPRATVRDWVRETSQAPVRLDRAPIARAALLRLADDEHVLALVSHRVVTDAWSMRHLFAELAVGYAAFAGGAEPAFGELPPVPTGPGPAGEQSAARLAGADFAVAPPADHPAAGRGRRQRSLSFAGPELARLAAEFAADAPIRTVLLAAYAQLLARFSGDYDLTVAAPAPDRRPAVLGPFENPVVTRVAMRDNPRFRELVRRMTADPADVPVESLLRELRPADFLEPGPLAAAAFDYADERPAPLEAAGLRMTVLDITQPGAE